MIIQLPNQPHLAASLAAGPVQRGQAPHYALILKGAYQLPAADGDGIRQMVPAPDPAHAAITFADEAGTVHGTGYQSDMALRKARCDISIAGWLDTPAAGSRGMEGSLSVASRVWFTRRTADTTAPPDDPDAVRNLFGWQPRTLPPRAITPAPPDDDPVLPAHYTAGFENSHRRTAPSHSPHFRTPGNNNTADLPAGSLIDIRQWRHGNETEAASYRLRSPHALLYTAQLRAWCGHGPDKARHWTVVTQCPLRCDTLAVYPAAHRAVLLWRCDWDSTLVPAAHWRKVQVLEGSG
ncbi:hypothetical protein OK351_03440 [Glutamicibacter sp. MNS18]|uniref:hypothetical protein n=1 Tax=Glutamicibacter sp. MNS18 TaxID=2989817 RepID=UPI002235CAD6|nr:hypothetical protein [Glutamicibacter sp. MNS18]MCW4464560.1 hypothetical protein [Glutamicibacter sp. MNS18]